MAVQRRAVLPRKPMQSAGLELGLGRAVAYAKSLRRRAGIRRSCRRLANASAAARASRSAAAFSRPASVLLYASPDSAQKKRACELIAGAVAQIDCAHNSRGQQLRVTNAAAPVASRDNS